MSEYLNVVNKTMIGDDGVIAIATTLETVVPPSRHEYIGCIRNIGAKHVNKDSHSLL